MNWVALGVIASLAAIYGAIREIVGSVLKKRKDLDDKRTEQIMEPLQAHSIVLKDTEMAIAAQSALLVQGRTDLAAEQKRRIEAEAECKTLRDKNAELENRNTDLLIQLGRMYGQQNGPGARPGV